MRFLSCAARAGRAPKQPMAPMPISAPNDRRLSKLAFKASELTRSISTMLASTMLASTKLRASSERLAVQIHPLASGFGHVGQQRDEILCKDSKQLLTLGGTCKVGAANVAG